MVKNTRRFLTMLLVPVLAALISAAAPAAPAQAAVANGVTVNNSELQILRYINASRRAKKLTPVKLSAGTTDVARRWSRQMAKGSTLAHNPNFASQVARSGSPRWGRITENVGYGSACNLKQLYQAYMKSPGHRKNILDPKVRYVGIGSVDRTAKGWSCGQVWNTMNFVDSYSGKYGKSRVAPTRPLNR
jgi:uncharacterized protein YkwD